MKQRVLFCMMLVAVSAYATVVSVQEQLDLNGATELVSIKQNHLAGSYYETCKASARLGYVFTHWSVSVDQQLTSRDEWNRSLDIVRMPVYESTTFTAHYLPADKDTDADGLPDGWEIYWFETLNAWNAADDPDGDGRSNMEEYAAQSNPLMAERACEKSVSMVSSDVYVYNPHNYSRCTIRSNSNGELVDVVSYYRPGSMMRTAKLTVGVNGFAYWTIDGAAVRDEWGRAVDQVVLTMPDRDVLIVAESLAGDSDNDGVEDCYEMYWYGNLYQDSASDTDHDGTTFVQEIAAGTNPLWAESQIPESVTIGSSSLFQYNPYEMHGYAMNCIPNDSLFVGTNGYRRPGSIVRTVKCSTVAGFAYWTVNGVPQRDAWGRAVDEICLCMPEENLEITAIKIDGDADNDGVADNYEIYWYGNLDQDAESDTDGDGRSFASEIAAGTNPLMPEEPRGDVVGMVCSNLQLMNLQLYEHVTGLVLNERNEEFFTSHFLSNANYSVTFTVNGYVMGHSSSAIPVAPHITDLNNDGLFDLIVTSSAATNVFLNVGSSGSPAFAATNGLSLAAVDWATNDVAQLANLSLDVAAPADALSCAFGDADQDGLDDLLVSDSEGRIWLYKGTQATEGTQAAGEAEGAAAASTGASTGQGESSLTFLGSLKSLSYSLQHKVWGGTYAGFASGLRIAVVDWDADGDLDCLCGTAEGKLMLLLDPAAGRPAGLVADAGVDSVNLSWNANTQSRVRGYRVYRKGTQATEGTEGTATASSSATLAGFAAVGSPTLAAYHDAPSAEGTYAYRVTSLSRSFTAGNSEPVITESKPSEAATATLGSARFVWRPASGFVGETVDIDLTVENSSGLKGHIQLSVAYDPAVLTPADPPVKTSAITAQFEPTVTASGADTLIVSGDLGEVVPNEHGVFLTFSFRVAAGADVSSTTVTVTDFTLETSGHGTHIEIPAPAQAVGIDGGAQTDPSYVVKWSLGDLDGDGRLTLNDRDVFDQWKGKAKDLVPTNVWRAGNFVDDDTLDARDRNRFRTFYEQRRLSGGTGMGIWKKGK